MIVEFRPVEGSGSVNFLLATIPWMGVCSPRPEDP
jgi:hypothetical protein